MSGLFIILFLVSIVTLLISIIKPSLFTKFITSSKKTLILANVGLVLFSFVMIGATAPESNIKGIQNEIKSTPTETITPIPTYTPSPTIVTPTVSPDPTNTPIPTKIPTVTPTKYILPTSKPTQIVIPTIQPQQPTVSISNGFSCNCKKTCTEISSCDEAYFQLNQCGCSVRDGDNDGIPCENLCQ